MTSETYELIKAIRLLKLAQAEYDRNPSPVTLGILQAAQALVKAKEEAANAAH